MLFCRPKAVYWILALLFAFGIAVPFHSGAHADEPSPKEQLSTPGEGNATRVFNIDEIDQAIASGRLSSRVAEKVIDDGFAEAIVTFDPSELLSEQAQLRKSAPAISIDSAIRSATQSIVAQQQQRVALAVERGVRVLQNYSSIPIQHVEITSLDGLLAYLDSSEVIGIGPNRINHATLEESLSLINQPAPEDGFTGEGTSVVRNTRKYWRIYRRNNCRNSRTRTSKVPNFIVKAPHVSSIKCPITSCISALFI